MLKHWHFNWKFKAIKLNVHIYLKCGQQTKLTSVPLITEYHNYAFETWSSYYFHIILKIFFHSRCFQDREFIITAISVYSIVMITETLVNYLFLSYFERHSQTKDTFNLQWNFDTQMHNVITCRVVSLVFITTAFLFLKLKLTI